MPCASYVYGSLLIHCLICQYSVSSDTDLEYIFISNKKNKVEALLGS